MEMLQKEYHAKKKEEKNEDGRAEATAGSRSAGSRTYSNAPR